MTKRPRTNLHFVAHYAAQVATSTQNLESAIRDARSDGFSLREIAQAAGVAHQTIANIVARPA